MYSEEELEEMKRKCRFIKQYLEDNTLIYKELIDIVTSIFYGYIFISIVYCEDYNINFGFNNSIDDETMKIELDKIIEKIEKAIEAVIAEEKYREWLEHEYYLIANL